MRERLEPGPEARAGPSYALGDGAHPAGPAGQQRDDPVRLTQLLGAQHDRFVTVEAHADHCPPRGRCEGADAAQVTSARGWRGSAAALQHCGDERDRLGVQPVRAGAATRGCCARPRTGRSASPRPASRRPRPGGSGRVGGRSPARGAWICRRRLLDGAIRPKKMPWMAAAIGAGRWSRVSSAMPAQNGTTPRGTSRADPRDRADTDTARSGPGTSAGRRRCSPASRRVVEHRHLQQQPAHPLGVRRRPPPARRSSPATYPR